MNAPLEPLPPTEPARRGVAHARSGAARAPLGACCAALGFFCFMPYPALGVGNASAVQTGNVIALLLSVPALFVAWKHRPFWVFPLLLSPLCVSALKAALSGQGGLDVCLKSLAVWTLSLLTILVTQLCAPRYAVHLLVGISAAMLLHAAVGAWQFYSFTNDEFPFAGLYVNPSFLSVQDNAAIIARYVRRPFGVFPEPSAMSSSLAPWVLFLFAVSSGAVRLRAQTTAAHRGLFMAAAAAGLGLIILSRSGHAAVVTAAVAALAAVWLTRARATPRAVVGVMALLGVVLPVVLYFAAASVGDRLGGKSSLGNSSWAERASSLVAGYELVAESDAATKLFGYGVGLVSPALQASHGLSAVFSVLLTYVFETGLVGALVIVWVGSHLLRGWAALRYEMTFALVTLVWLIGVTLITSYEQLLPLWMTLGWLTVWQAVCEPVAVRRRAAAASTPAPRRQALWVTQAIAAAGVNHD